MNSSLTNNLPEIPQFIKSETVLHTPGQFIFQLLEDDEIKIGKNHQIGRKRIEEIVDAIRLIFKTISENIQKYSLNIDKPYYESIIRKLRNFVNSKTLRFPGLQVINMSKDHIEVFSKICERILICEKSDGVRYLLIHFSNGNILFVGRNLEFYLIQTVTPLPTSGKHKDWEIENFLDGELIVDRVKKSNEEIKKLIAQKNESKTTSHSLLNLIQVGENYFEVKFLIFDAIVVNAENIGHLKFRDRLKRLSEFFFLKDTKKKFMMKYSPFMESSTLESLSRSNVSYKAEIQSHAHNKISQTKFSIEIFMKDYYTFDKIDHLYSSVSKNLSHDNDGVIINLDDYPYYSGQSFEIYKWKPANLNTIDFEITSLNNEHGRLYILNVAETRDKILPVSCLFFRNDEEKSKFEQEIEELNVSGKPIIAECFYDFEFNSEDVINFHLLCDMGIIKRNDTLDKSEGLIHLGSYNPDYLSQRVSQTSYFNTKPYEQGGWQFMRFRKDKLQPNSLYTYVSVWKTIKENLGMTEIMSKIKENNTKTNHINLDLQIVLSTFLKNSIKENMSKDEPDFTDDSCDMFESGISQSKPVNQKNLNTSFNSPNSVNLPNTPSSDEFLKRKRNKEMLNRDESFVEGFNGINIESLNSSMVSPPKIKQNINQSGTNTSGTKSKSQRDKEKKEKAIRQQSQTLDLAFS
jgi:ATP-dependent DNA ligase